ncbi:MAG: nuclear transport factor 2 family protein [Desulfobaccales bacterium]
MLTHSQAEKLAATWAQAINHRDLEALLTLYAPEVELTSPFVVQLLHDPGGTLKGKENLRMYFTLGLSLFPDLSVTVLQVLAGVSSLVVVYRGADEVMAADVMFLNAEGLISRVFCHYHAESD